MEGEEADVTLVYKVGGKFPEDQVKDAAVGKHVFEELVSFLLF
jgi:hypothetical protein